MTPAPRAPLGAALALLLALAALSGAAAPVIGAGVVIVLSLAIGAGWPSLAELRASHGTRRVVALTGVGSALLTLTAGERLDPFAALAVVCAGGVFAAFVHQMLRQERTGLAASLTSTVAGALLTGLAGAWVTALVVASATGLMVVPVAAAMSLAVGSLVASLPIAPTVRIIAGVAAASATAMVLLDRLGGFPLWQGGLLGLLLACGTAGVVALLQSQLVSRDPAPSLAAAAAPVATAGTIVLLAVQLLR
ncbi:hypothetical protein JSY14_09055 [Brachybacterium sp. EF45031]|uniref:hypothetical protein n=1 Tax=Brachybacterium sillae TaxID=2810536 RepID=UPI00217DF6B5|nr:hypothetical protein [Brachybacterium sillae]MCS6712162.1 hypothetical protein [Brachybacterium sillae]